MSQADAFYEALRADACHPESLEKLALFGQFVGVWDLDWTGYEPDGSTMTVQGEWIFAWVLEGRAIQDIWICPSRTERRKPGMPSGEYGTSLRFYDGKIDAWRVVWIGPAHHNFQTFLAHEADGEIIIENHDPERGIIRWIFSAITPQSFHWRYVSSPDQGGTWTLHETMDVRRRNEKDGSL